MNRKGNATITPYLNERGFVIKYVISMENPDGTKCGDDIVYETPEELAMIEDLLEHLRHRQQNKK
jgi:hypothetical protein